MHIKTWLGDITTLDVDAIMNPANYRLSPGGRAWGAIHRAAGPQLAEECARIGPCRTGDAKATAGYALPAHWVIHAVGPVWHDGEHREVELLASAYRRSIEMADELGATSIAFPAISTGIFGFPADLAATTAVQTLRTLTPEHVERCVLVAFDEEALRRLAGALDG